MTCGCDVHRLRGRTRGVRVAVRVRSVRAGRRWAGEILPLSLRRLRRPLKQLGNWRQCSQTRLARMQATSDNRLVHDGRCFDRGALMSSCGPLRAIEAQQRY